MQKVDLNKYTEFVRDVTSNESNDFSFFAKRCVDLQDSSSLSVSLLLTAAIGLGSESGEFQEIVKKMIFQGKDFNEDVRFHMKRELGDIMWYWINACRALHLNPNDVISENVEKLKARYPNGEFDVFYSENRKDGDL